MLVCFNNILERWSSFQFKFDEMFLHDTPIVITELKIHHLFIIFIYHIHDDFDSADPISTQGACHV